MVRIPPADSSNLDFRVAATLSQMKVSLGTVPNLFGNAAFLMKDVVLLAVSIYLLKQDVTRAALDAEVAKFTLDTEIAGRELGKVRVDRGSAPSTSASTTLL